MYEVYDYTVAYKNGFVGSHLGLGIQLNYIGECEIYSSAGLTTGVPLQFIIELPGYGKSRDSWASQHELCTSYLFTKGTLQEGKVTRPDSDIYGAIAVFSPQLISVRRGLRSDQYSISWYSISLLAPWPRMGRKVKRVIRLSYNITYIYIYIYIKQVISQENNRNPTRYMYKIAPNLEDYRI